MLTLYAFVCKLVDLTRNTRNKCCWFYILNLNGLKWSDEFIDFTMCVISFGSIYMISSQQNDLIFTLKKDKNRKLDLVSLLRKVRRN